MSQAASKQFPLLDRWRALQACFCQPLDGQIGTPKRAADARAATPLSHRFGMQVTDWV
jgi:hypothetical protein